MREWIAPKCRYMIDGNTVTADGSVREKISGTTLGAFLGKSPYMTPFEASTKLMGLWDEDISDKPAIIVGKALEERIIGYLGTKHASKGNFFKVEELGLGERVGDHAHWLSDFQDDVFAGHIDGIVSKDGEDFILEIKTANRRQIEQYHTWVNGVPEHYLWQVYLYNHFITKKDKAYFGLGIVDQSTYDNPYSWVPCAENCKLFEVTIDQEKVAETIENVRKQYNETVAAGRSVPMSDVPNDRDLMTHLRDISGTTDDLNKLIQEFTVLHAKNEEWLSERKADLDNEKKLRERIKDTMHTWNLKGCANAYIQHSNRAGFDFKRADADGFDYTKYLTSTPVNTLKFKE